MAHWQGGRQRCEELSLTGNNCTHRRHTLPGTSAASDDKRSLPSVQCCSGVQYIAACNCGRRQANREDPYKLVDANYNFSQLLEEEVSAVMTDGEEEDGESGPVPGYLTAQVNTSIPTVSFNTFPNAIHFSKFANHVQVSDVMLHSLLTLL